jgi:hypothetical protein
MPRRLSLRRLLEKLEKGGTAGDLGPVRVERRNGYIRLGVVSKSKSTKGFSLLIKETGFYTVKGNFAVTVQDFSGSQNGLGLGESFSLQSGEEERFCFFYALLPLVFRAQEGVLAAGQKRRFLDLLKNRKRPAGPGGDAAGGIIAAEDEKGIAALIGREGENPVVLYRRENKAAGFCFMLTGNSKSFSFLRPSSLMQV